MICGRSFVTDFSRRTAACWLYKAAVDSSWCRVEEAGAGWMSHGGTHPQRFI